MYKLELLLNKLMLKLKFFFRVHKLQLLLNELIVKLKFFSHEQIGITHSGGFSGFSSVALICRRVSGTSAAAAGSGSTRWTRCRTTHP